MLFQRAVLIACIGIAMIAEESTPNIVMNPKSGLRTWEVGSGHLPVVLLHGYGSSPDEWLPFTATIQLPGAGRFVFAEAPDETRPPDGPVGGRAWWRLDLAGYRGRGETVPDLSRAHPEGLVRSTRAIRTLVAEVEDRLGSRPAQTVLGGFSQGAMISADIAFRTDEPLHALILLSGTFVDEASWTQAMPARRGLPVFIAHGRQDQVLPFDSASRLAEAMRRAGLQVTWVPFDGGHEIPAGVVTELNHFLATH